MGEDVKAVQFGWAPGMPLVAHLGSDIWEVRIRLETRIARIGRCTKCSVLRLSAGQLQIPEMRSKFQNSP